MRTFFKPLLFLILLSQSVAAFAEGNGGYAYKVSDVRDLALIYQGGSHRIEWTQDQFVPYVTHTFADGHKDWLFDGFLFLEFNDGQGYAYASGGGEKKGDMPMLRAEGKRKPARRNGSGFLDVSLKKGSRLTLWINA